MSRKVSGLALGLVLCSMLVGCSSTTHLLVKKEDFAMAERCLIAEQSYQPILAAQQANLQYSLAVLRDSLMLHQRNARVRAANKRADSDDPSELQLEMECLADSMNPQLLSDQQLDKQVVGEKEEVLFTDLDLVMRARIDTGATTSSLDAQDIQLFERDGEEWVRFYVTDPDTEEPIQLERKRVRRVLITQANVETPERRPVIEMQVTIGRITQEAEFTLADRSHLEFGVLIGRNVLRDVMMVDVSKVNFAPLVPPTRPSHKAL